ncbi:MAG: rbsB [Conexibacter sp.]|nr:rbsB [Conexibacter sp.]
MRMSGALATAAACSLTLTMAACGSDDEGGSATVASGSTAATAAAPAAPIKVDKKTIGIVNLVRQSPAEDKIDQLYLAAGKALGWDVKIVDGAGDPQKIATAAQNFVNQGVDALITTSTDAAAIRGALNAAKAKEIPTISTNGGTTKSPLFTAQFEEDEPLLGRQLAQQIAKDDSSPQVGSLVTDIAISGPERYNELPAVLGKSAVVSEQKVDLTNPVVNTQKTLTDMLTAKPGIKEVAAVYDNMAQAAITTIRSKGSKAKLYTYYTTPNNVKNLRGNTALAALSDVDAPKTGAVAFDQLLEYFQKKTAIDPNALQTGDNKLTYNVVTKDNVDQLLGSRDEQYTVTQILAPFLKKWAAEYPGS